MNWKSFILGVGVGLAGGYAARELLAQKTFVTPEKTLTNAKEMFKTDGPISGSWIYMKAEPFTMNQLKYEVYRGGISRFSGEEAEQFEFKADAKTGTILQVQKLS